MKKIDHQVPITLGCLIWIASFFGEAFGFQPYSTTGIIVSPILIVFGLFQWFKYYRATRGYYPKFRETWKRYTATMKVNQVGGIDSLFKYMLEFWTLTIVFWIGTFLFGFLMFGQSDAFAEAKHYCESEQDILEKTGKIKYYGSLVGGTIKTQNDGGSADFSFTIIGENGNFPGHAQLTKHNGKWTVDDLVIFDKY